MQPEPWEGMDGAGCSGTAGLVLLSQTCHPPPASTEKTAFARDHALSPVTLQPLCPGCWEQPAPLLLCWAGPEKQLILGHKGTLGTVTS